MYYSSVPKSIGCPQYPLVLGHTVGKSLSSAKFYLIVFAKFRTIDRITKVKRKNEIHVAKAGFLKLKSVVTIKIFARVQKIIRLLKREQLQILDSRVNHEVILSPKSGRLYIGRRNESARADRRVMRKKTGASTILKEIEENRDFELFSSSGHF